jgi:hypothetical protein
MNIDVNILTFFARKWIDPEIIILSDMNQSCKEKYHLLLSLVESRGKQNNKTKVMIAKGRILGKREGKGKGGRWGRE